KSALLTASAVMRTPVRMPSPAWAPARVGVLESWLRCASMGVAPGWVRAPWIGSPWGCWVVLVLTLVLGVVALVVVVSPEPGAIWLVAVSRPLAPRAPVNRSLRMLASWRASP